MLQDQELPFWTDRLGCSIGVSCQEISQVFGVPNENWREGLLPPLAVPRPSTKRSRNECAGAFDKYRLFEARPVSWLYTH